jgi:hypothetical protein
MLAEGLALWRQRLSFKQSSRSLLARAIMLCRHLLLQRGFFCLRSRLERSRKLQRVEDRLGLGRRHYRINLLRNCFRALQSIFLSSRDSVLRWRQRHQLVLGFGLWVRLVRELQEQSHSRAIGEKVLFKRVGGEFLLRLRWCQTSRRAEADRLALATIFHSLIGFKISLMRLFFNKDSPSRASIARRREASLVRHEFSRQRGSLSQTLRALSRRANSKRILLFKLLTFHRSIALRSLDAWVSHCSAKRSGKRLLTTATDLSARRRLSKTLRSSSSQPPLASHVAGSLHSYSLVKKDRRVQAAGLRRFRETWLELCSLRRWSGHLCWLRWNQKSRAVSLIASLSLSLTPPLLHRLELFIISRRQLVGGSAPGAALSWRELCLERSAIRRFHLFDKRDSARQLLICSPNGGLPCKIDGAPSARSALTRRLQPDQRPFSGEIAEASPQQHPSADEGSD